MEKKELSYVMVKPEFANSKIVVNEIIKRIKNEGLNIVEAGFVQYTKEDAKKHYAEHINAKFYKDLEAYITSDVAYGMVVEGENAIARVRNLVLKDKEAGLQPGDIRYDIPAMLNQKTDMTKNVIHASDKIESAIKEIAIFESLQQKYIEL